MLAPVGVKITISVAFPWMEEQELNVISPDLVKGGGSGSETFQIQGS